MACPSEIRFPKFLGLSSVILNSQSSRVHKVAFTYGKVKWLNNECNATL